MMHAKEFRVHHDFLFKKRVKHWHWPLFEQGHSFIKNKSKTNLIFKPV